jgi:hypothetical protein
MDRLVDLVIVDPNKRADVPGVIVDDSAMDFKDIRGGNRRTKTKGLWGDLPSKNPRS